MSAPLSADSLSSSRRPYSSHNRIWDKILLAYREFYRQGDRPAYI